MIAAPFYFWRSNMEDPEELIEWTKAGFQDWWAEWMAQDDALRGLGLSEKAKRLLRSTAECGYTAGVRAMTNKVADWIREERKR